MLVERENQQEPSLKWSVRTVFPCDVSKYKEKKGEKKKICYYGIEAIVQHFSKYAFFFLSRVRLDWKQEEAACLTLSNISEKFCWH